MKTIGIHKSTHNGSCDFIVEIANVEKKQYEQLVNEEIKNREEQCLKEKELYDTIANMSNKIKELSHEIAILKGEE